MILFPNCKINLGLNILSRREDGYHNIETVMVPVPLADILELVPSPDGETRLFVSGNAVDCPAEKNLVMKAYNAVKDEVEDLPATHIYLRKIIPDGAGLGGGSADASFTVRGLDSLWQLGLSVEQMERIASSVGADCPFFIKNKPALAIETGTTLLDFPNPVPEGMIIALAKPDSGVSTKEAYAGVTPVAERDSLTDLLSNSIDRWQGIVRNDFEESVGVKVPEVLEIKNDFLNAGAVYAAMSGSGSAVFGLFRKDSLPELNSLLEGYRFWNWVGEL